MKMLCFFHRRRRKLRNIYSFSPSKHALYHFHQQPVKVGPTSLVAASSGSENLEISIYNTLPFVKVNPWYFSFFTPKIRASLWQFRLPPVFVLQYRCPIKRTLPKGSNSPVRYLFCLLFPYFSCLVYLIIGRFCRRIADIPAPGRRR